MPNETRSLHRKLAQVMYEAERIPKTGVAPAAMGGFRFVEAGVAADVIRKALADKVITMIPTAIELVDSTEHETASKKMMTTMTVRTTWTLTDGDSGETIQIQSLGSGADMGDKAAPKAQTSAMKYALLMGFLLSTGDDPERVDTSDRQPVQRQPEQATLSGIAEVGKAPHDFQPREGRDGPQVGFGLKGDNGHVRVVASGAIAAALALVKDDVIGKLVHVSGTATRESWEINKGKPNAYAVPYTLVMASRIQTPTLILPADTTPGGEAPGGPPEAEAAGESLGGSPAAPQQMTAADWESAA